MISYLLLLLLSLCLVRSEVSAFSRLPTLPQHWKQNPSLKREVVPPLLFAKKPSVIPPSSSGSQPLETSPLVKLASSPLGALIILAGVVLFHESGHYLTARALGIRPQEFSIGFGPKLFCFQAFGDEFSLRALLLGGYVKFRAEVLQALQWKDRALIYSAGVVCNLFLAFLIYYGQVKFGPGLPNPVLDRGVLVNAVGGPEAAAYGILKEGDVILTVNGTPVTKSQTPSVAEAQRAISNTIRSIQATRDGISVELSVLRSQKSLPVDVSIVPNRTALQDGKPGPPTLGVLLEPNLVRIEMLQSESILEAARLASRYVFELTRDTTSGLYTFVGDLISRRAETSEYKMKGPIGVMKTASAVVATQDWNEVFKYVATISINLGVINTFPIPPSDGFQIVALLWSQLQSS